MSIDIRGSATLFEVFDMPTSIAFYCGVLGFEIISTSNPGGDRFGWALLRLNDVALMLNTAYEDDERPPVRDPNRAFGLGVGLYFGCPDVDAAYEHLRAHGVDLKPPRIADYGMKQLYVRDPDGYTLCFQWPAT